jgi:hypothetical protein
MEKLVTELIKFQIILRLFHWKTTSYAKHQALGSAYSALDGLLDSFVEIYQGKNDRLSGIGALKVSGVTLDSAIADIANILVDSSAEIFDEKTDTDLLNVRDEILAEINKLSFLLTLK